jgi:hypothetical protein
VVRNAVPYPTTASSIPLFWQILAATRTQTHTIPYDTKQVLRSPSGKHLLLLSALKQATKQFMLFESPRERSPHKRPLPTSTRSIGFCVIWVSISSSSSSKQAALGKTLHFPLMLLSPTPLNNIRVLSWALPTCEAYILVCALLFIFRT